MTQHMCTEESAVPLKENLQRAYGSKHFLDNAHLLLENFFVPTGTPIRAGAADRVANAMLSCNAASVL